MIYYINELIKKKKSIYYLNISNFIYLKFFFEFFT
jgi:hypothetical protein